MGDGPNSLAKALERARQQGRQVLDLAQSNPTAAGLVYPSALPTSLRSQGSVRYHAHSLGAPAARACIAEHWAAQGVACPPEHLALTASTSEAYSFLFKLLCDPGDNVLIPSPSYPLFEHLARLESVHVRPYRLVYDGSWYIDMESVATASTARTRAVLIVNPNNPTGNYLRPEQLAALHRLGLPLISDEVFRGYPLTDSGGSTPALPPSAGVAEAPVLTFVLDGLSKWAGLPQLKLAWCGVFGPQREVTDALSRLELIGDTFLSVAGPVQTALPDLLRAGASIHASIAARVRGNLALVRRLLAEETVTVLHAEGGWYVTLRLPLQVDDGELALQLLEQAGVYMQPGWYYDFDGAQHTVLSLLTPADELEQGVVRLRDLVREQLARGLR